MRGGADEDVSETDGGEVMTNNMIDRNTYRSIKKMSREELQAFLMRVNCHNIRGTINIDI